MQLSKTIKALFVANIACYLLAGLVGPEFYSLFGLIPAKVVQRFWLWQLASYMFLHGNFVHIFFNLFALWMFGRPVEASWGSQEFLKYYFITGVGAAVFNVLLTPGSPYPIVGASGAVYGLLVAFAMLYPDAKVYLYFIIPISAKHLVILFAVIEFLASAGGSTSHIARLAHLGGMITGYVYLRWWWEIKIWAKSRLSDLARWPSQWGRKSRSYRAGPSQSEDLEEEVNRILDKILAKGVDSLTSEEKEIMRKYSKRQGLRREGVE